MKKIIVMAIVLFVVAFAFGQGTDIQSDIERVWGYETVIVQPYGIDSMATAYLNVFKGYKRLDGEVVQPKLKDANGIMSIGIICYQTAGTPVTMIDSVWIRLTSADVFTKNDTLWGEPMFLTQNDTIRVGRPTRNSWNQKFNVNDLQIDVVAASNSDHKGYMPAMLYAIDIYMINETDAAARFRFTVGFVVED